MNIEEGGRVKHRKDGAGTVLRIYTKRGTARCKMDSGKETTYSVTRLTPIPASSGAAAAPSSPTDSSAHVRRKGGSSGVDYVLLEEARAAISGQYPDADHVVPRMYQGRVYCEVWYDQHAWTVFYDDPLANLGKPEKSRTQAPPTKSVPKKGKR